MALQFATVNSGFTVSSAVALQHAPAALAVQIPNSITGLVKLQFATALDASSIAFAQLACPDGSGADFIVGSGGNTIGVVPQVPTGFVRVRLSTAPGYTVTSIGIYPVQ